MKVRDVDGEVVFLAGALVHDEVAVAVGKRLEVGEEVGVANVIEVLMREEADTGLEPQGVEIGDDSFGGVDGEMAVGGLDEGAVGGEGAVGEGVDFQEFGSLGVWEFVSV